MSTNYKHILYLGFPTAQIELARRVGYACSEFVDLTGPERINIIQNGGYPLDHPETLNFTFARYSANGGASLWGTVGAVQMNDAWWARAQSVLVGFPASVRYARWQLTPEETWTLRETDVPALQPYLQTELSQVDAIALAGLVPYRG